MKKTLIIAFALIALVGLQADAQVSHSSTTVLPISNATNPCTGADGAGGVTDTIAFAETGTISDVDVAVEIIHTWRSDLQFHVEYSVGAAGAIVLAADHDGGDDDYYATFDDEAGMLCSDATMCGSGSAICVSGSPATCMPDVALSAFDGLTSPGTWTLMVCDDAGGDDGELMGWTVTVDGDGDLPVELMSFMVE